MLRPMTSSNPTYKKEAYPEPCITCDKRDCGATVILPSLDSGKKHFDSASQRLDVECPACNRLFSISIFKLEWLEVKEQECARGFFGGKRRKARAAIAGRESLL
jgi:hypothetical protein